MTRFNFIIRSALTMSLISVLMFLGSKLAYTFSGIITGTISRFLLFRDLWPDAIFHGDNTPAYVLIVIIIVWLVIGLLWGYVLWLIRSRNTDVPPRFDITAIITTLVVQVGLSALIFYIGTTFFPIS